MPADSSTNLSGLPARIVQEKLLTAEQVQDTQARATKAQRPLLSQLIDDQSVPAHSLASLGADEFGIPLLDLGAFNLEHAPVKKVSEKLLRKHQALPLFQRGKTLFVGITDPTDTRALDEIKFNTGLTTQPIIVEYDKLEKTLEKALETMDSSLADLTDSDLSDLDNLDISGGDDEDDAADVAASDVDDAPVVRFVHKILLDAINSGSSDIHIEPYEKTFRVRYRQDGVLREIAKPPVGLANRISARLKVMARLDIAERRKPQDGRIKLSLSRSRAVDFRINTLPTLHGEKIVMRILDSATAQLGVDALGFDDQQKKLFVDAIHKPWGMVLVTGPTGSGKTVSLYSALNMLNTEDRNISTAEDPVEIQMAGVNQVHVNPKIGFNFSDALRAFLRQDPDIIMVGEIRDLETAEIAIKAAQTGHMVLSTLHTNSAAQTLNRLDNMGVAAFNIASSISLIVAQRLGRKLCEKCRAPAELPEKALLDAGFEAAEIKGLEVYKAVGCDACNNGYRGRTAIHEVLPIDEAMQEMILRGANTLEYQERQKELGYPDLRRSGLNKVKAGITSLEELNRVITG